MFSGRGILGLLLVAVLGFLTFANQADARMKAPTCWPKINVYKPAVMKPLCSASLAADGITLTVWIEDWTSWHWDGAKGRGTAEMPKAWFTNRWPETCANPCRLPMVTKKVNVVLSRPLLCWNGQTRFGRVRLVIDQRTAFVYGFSCPQRPRLKVGTAKGLFNRSAELRQTKRHYLRCSRIALMRVRCQGKWSDKWTYYGTQLEQTWKLRGWVKRTGSTYTVKVRSRTWGSSSASGSYGPYSSVNWYRYRF